MGHYSQPRAAVDPEMISNIMFACIVIYNIYMIIKDELNANLEPLYDPDAPNNL